MASEWEIASSWPIASYYTQRHWRGRPRVSLRLMATSEIRIQNRLISMFGEKVQLKLHVKTLSEIMKDTVTSKELVSRGQITPEQCKRRDIWSNIHGETFPPASLCSQAGRYDNLMPELTLFPRPVRDYEFGEFGYWVWYSTFYWNVSDREASLPRTKENQRNIL